MTIQSKPSIARLTSAEATIDESDEGAFGIVDLLRFVRVRHRIILGTAFTVIALVTAVILQVTPLYSSNAVVMLDQRKNNVEDTDAVLSGLPADQTAVQNQVQILTSLELAGRVVDKLRLSDDPEFNPKAGAGGWGAILKKLNPLRWLMADRKTQADALQENRERM